MKYFAALVGLAFAFVVLQARGQSTPDDQYVSIYSLIQQADSLQAAGQARQALTEYSQALEQLQKFQKVFPDWNARIVSFRLNYVGQKVSDLTAQVPAVPKTSAPSSASAPGTGSTPSPAAGGAPGGNGRGDDATRTQLDSLRSENATLQAKLREALSAQPSAADAQEAAMAQQQVKTLLKENELLRTTVEQQKNAKPAMNSKDAADAKELQLALAETKQKLAAQSARADQLAQEYQSLQAKAPSKSPEATQLQQENVTLKKQLALLQVSAGQTPPANAAADGDAPKLRAQVAELQSDADVQWLEKIALEKRLQQLQSQPPSPPTPAPQPAPQPAVVTPPPAVPSDVNAPEPTPAKPVETPTFAEVPVTALAAEAQAYFSAGSYDKAEADYEKILQRDRNNGVALANLAAIEMQEGKLSEADQHITTALADHPDDAYDLSIYGYLKFRQQKYTEALDALSRAAKADPRNAQIQNYLGVALNHEGRQAEAEQALLKAVEIDPNYAAAHNNLAVVYISEQPPKAELARSHYQKAIENGQPHNADMEKMLANKGAPVAAQ